MAADEVIDLSASGANAPDPKSEVKLGQFHRDLSHILIPEPAEGEESAGPLITLGTYRLQFKPKAPSAHSLS